MGYAETTDEICFAFAWNFKWSDLGSSGNSHSDAADNHYIVQKGFQHSQLLIQSRNTLKLSSFQSSDVSEYNERKREFERILRTFQLSFSIAVHPNLCEFL